MREIEVIIEPDGTIRVKTHGLLGEECLDATAGLAQLGQVRADERTREFRMARAGTTSVRTRTGK